MKELYKESLIYAITDPVYKNNPETGEREIRFKSTLESWDGCLDKNAKDGDHIGKLTYKINKPFHASLTCTGVGRGTSACKFHWENETHDYTMFPSDVYDLLSMNIMTNPLEGYFVIVKKGANFGIKYLGKINPNGRD